MTTLLDPQGLIAALESGDYAKTRGRFETTRESRIDDSDEGIAASTPLGFCCLGVYAKACGMDYKPAQGSFRSELDARVAVDGDASLPTDHWLLTYLDIPSTRQPLQAFLADLNDDTPDFKAVIYVLREFDAGRRGFPDAAQIIKLVYADA